MGAFVWLYVGLCVCRFQKHRQNDRLTAIECPEWFKRVDVPIHHKNRFHPNYTQRENEIIHRIDCGLTIWHKLVVNIVKLNFSNLFAVDFSWKTIPQNRSNSIYKLPLFSHFRIASGDFSFYILDYALFAQNRGENDQN